jgi:hypothetical protein
MLVGVMDDSLLSGLVAMCFAWLVIVLVGTASSYLFTGYSNDYYYDYDQCVGAELDWVIDDYGGWCDDYNLSQNYLVNSNLFIGFVLLVIAGIAMYFSKNYEKNKVIATGIFFGGILIIIYGLFLLISNLAIYGIANLFLPLVVFSVLIYFILKRDENKIKPKNKK